MAQTADGVDIYTERMKTMSSSQTIAFGLIAALPIVALYTMIGWWGRIPETLAYFTLF